MSTEVPLTDDCGLGVLPEEPFTNPFLMVYNSVFNLPLKDSRFVRLVDEGNRIRFDQSDRDPIKRNTSTADYPEVMLIPRGFQDINLHSNSSSSRLRYGYQWIISTGDFRYSIISAVEWALFAAMSKYRCEVTTLQWGEKVFALQLNIDGSQMGEQESLQRRGLNGWAVLWNIFVEMNFSHVDLSNGVTIP